MKTVTETFDEWYAKLTETQKEELLDHIYNATRLTEGYNAGPAITSSKPKKCPYCGNIIK